MLIKAETVPQKDEGTYKVTKQLVEGYQLREAHLPIKNPLAPSFLPVSNSIPGARIVPGSEKACSQYLQNVGKTITVIENKLQDLI